MALTRRQLLQAGLAGGLWLGRPRLARAGEAATPAPSAKARSVIQIWMWGGVSHLDTLDPKPEAGSGYHGPLGKPIATTVDGLALCELLPLLAGQADKYSVIRSLTHGINAHETAAYMVQTGRKPGGRLVFPGAGAVVSLFKGRQRAGGSDLIPAYVVLTELQGRFSESGFLGPGYSPFATGGDPNRTPFVVQGVVAPGISVERQRARRELLHQLDTFAAAVPSAPLLGALAATEDQAYQLILGDSGKVFDLAQETDAVRERYGNNTFGQSCLVARRLVERGVPYVTINSKGWDTHKQNFPAMKQKLPQLDRGLATLLQDLSERGLLESTVVWCCGEFGRTPKIQWEAPWNGGRGHWGAVFSALIAGGGFKGGRVVGSSDARGEQVRDRPVAPAQVLAAIYGQLGIDPEAPLPNPEGADLRVSPPVAERGAPLSEIL